MNFPYKLLPTTLLPTILDLLLVLILAFSFSKLSASFFSQEPTDVAVADTPELLRQPDRQQKLSSFTPGEVIREHQADEAPLRSPGAPDAMLQLELRGVVAQEDRHNGLAIIKQANFEEQYFNVGDEVFDQGILVEIHSDRVVLLHDGESEILYLAGRLAVDAASQSADANRIKRRMPTSEEYVAFMRDEMKKIHAKTLKEMRNPWQYVYYEPAIVDGKIVGLRLNANEEKEFLGQYGIELGDTIVSVNGNDLNGGASVARAIDALSDSDILELVVDHDGQTKTVVIRNDRDLD